MHLKKIILLFITMVQAQLLFANWNQDAIDAFIKRTVKEKAVFFEVVYMDAKDNKDVFELESNNGKIMLRGNNGVSIGSALNYYLKNYCHCLITWNGVNMNMPAKLPAVEQTIHKTSPYKYRHYLNYCTFNYSLAWWDWDRWQKEIDWMTLNGINTPLALTGESSIWKKVYKKMGFTDDQLDKFFCGPSYFSWFWMGNLDAWGGPLPQHWMDTHEVLQKKILAAERSMGMQAVLPAFTGHVPASFKEKFPGAAVKKTNWNSGFDDVYILDPSDPMFEVVGKKFLEEQTKIYGTDHLYSADTFNENIPPTDDSMYLNDISKKVFASMTQIDPQAIWVMQGWMFHYQSAFWRPAQMQALLNAIPDDQMIILDLYSESFPLWKKTNAYYGKPWIWNMLHNFGGNTSLWGRMDEPAEDPSAALHDNASGKIAGIGLTPEGIEQNPILYQLMLENVWQDTPINIENWLKQYTLQRYGVVNDDVNKAWSILSKSVYRGGLTEGGPESIITGRPTLDAATKWTRTELDYDNNELTKAWKLFIKAAPLLKNNQGFQYDLVDVTRQVLANYASPLQQSVASYYYKEDLNNFKIASNELLGLMDNLDQLLGTQKDFLLGKWIADARSNGITTREKNLYEFNARDLITLWGDKESPLHEYSCRMWSGLIKGFYKPRWQQYVNFLEQSIENGSVADEKAFEKNIKNWEWKWVNSHEKYRSQPMGDPVRVAEMLFKMYFPKIEKEI